MSASQLGLPKLRVGTGWIPRPRRSLSFLLTGCCIPVLFSQNIRHFTLLAKYRPPLGSTKQPSLWDWLAYHAKKRLTAKTVQQEAGNRRRGKIAIDPHTPNAIRWPPEAFINRGWPTLHTARRLLVRRYPKLRIVNHEMYASLAEPKPPDVLTHDWKSRHQKVQAQILQQSAGKTNQHFICKSSNQEYGGVLSLTSARSAPAPISRNISSVTHTIIPKYKSAHTARYLPKEDEIVKDNLPVNWKEKHRIKQDHLLQKKEERDRMSISFDSTQSSCTRIKLPTETSAVILTKSSNNRQRIPIIGEGDAKRFLPVVPDDKQLLLDAELGLIKDWIRSQITACQPNDSASAVSDLRFRTDQLAFKLTEMNKLLYQSEKRTSTRLSIQVANCMKDIRADMQENLQAIRDYVRHVPLKLPIKTSIKQPLIRMRSLHKRTEANPTRSRAGTVNATISPVDVNCVTDICSQHIDGDSASKESMQTKIIVAGYPNLPTIISPECPQKQAEKSSLVRDGAPVKLTGQTSQIPVLDKTATESKITTRNVTGNIRPRTPASASRKSQVLQRSHMYSPITMDAATGCVVDVSTSYSVPQEVRLRSSSPSKRIKMCDIADVSVNFKTNDPVETPGASSKLKPKRLVNIDPDLIVALVGALSQASQKLRKYKETNKSLCAVVHDSTERIKGLTEDLKTPDLPTYHWKQNNRQGKKTYLDV